MKNYKKAWYILPTKLIEIGIQNSKKDDDFDRHLSFLLLDVGVENALKAFLEEGVEKIGFSELIKKVNTILIERKTQGLDLNEVMKFHKIRNKLYHEGNGITPTKEHVKEYGILAENLLKVLLDIEINNTENDDKYDEVLQINLNALRFNSAIIVEHLYPNLATRKILGQIRYIDKTIGLPNGIDVPLSAANEWQEQRIEEFNKLTGLRFTEDNAPLLNDFFIYPENFHVWLALKEVSDDWEKDWGKYININTSRKSFSEEQYKISLRLSDLFSNWIKENIDGVEPEDSLIIFE